MRVSKNDRVIVQTGRKDKVLALATDVPENDNLVRVIDSFGKHEWWINRFQIVKVI